MNTADLYRYLPRLADFRCMDEETFRRDGADILASLEPSFRKQSVPFPPLKDGESRVREERMEGLLSALTRLTKRAEKLGVAVPVVTQLYHEVLPVVVTFPHRDQWWWAYTGGVRRFTVLTATTEPVRLPGWTFVGTIEHLGEDGNILRIVPAFTTTLPAAYRTDGPTCEHCHRQRRRNETFVLQHADGHFVRVGRNCLTDYIGSSSADRLVDAATIARALSELMMDDWDGEGGCGYGPVRATMPATFLRSVALVIEKVGWCSRKLARDTDRMSTADYAWRRLFPGPGKASPEELELRHATTTTVHAEDAEKALAWAREIPVDTDNDFLHNCRVVASLPAWDGSKIGIGAAILMAYQKEQERLKRLAFERRMPAVPFGVVGERFGVKASKKLPKPLPAVRARVLGVHTFEGDRGLVTIVRLQAPAGEAVHDFVWFASGEVQIVIDAAAVAAREAAENHYAVARTAWVTADTNVHRARYDKAMEPEDRVACLQVAERALQDLKQAETEDVATWAPAQEAMRSVAPGDLVDLVGTVKRHTLSDKSKRMETHVSRCVLTYISEESEA